MLVELKEICKSFGNVHANRCISLRIPAGTIQGVLGENGAGKSTLMKVLSGFIHADSGQILLDGQIVKINSPADAIHFGVGMLHQDPLDFPPLKVIDNFIMGQKGSLFPDRQTTTCEFKQLAEQFGFSLSPDTYVDTLTVGERQQLEILRLLWMGARVLILDEPTTGISSLQKEKLFSTLRLLAEQGKTIIFVSHKLEDIKQLCHRVVVLRQGELIGEAQTPFIANELVSMMFGKEITIDSRQRSQPGKGLLLLQDLTIEDGFLCLRDINLEVRAGEVVGLAGMEGSGQRSFLRGCAGLIHPTGGQVIVNQRDLTGKTYLDFKQHGVSYLPASRLEDGLIPGLTLAEHFMLAEEMEGLFIERQKGEQLAKERIEAFNIRGNPSSYVEDLSGGNQQRALLALLRAPLSLILLEHPTRGLDIESMIYIWKKLKSRCDQGTAIIFISSDLEEILQYSDRILVFFSGQLLPILDASKTNIEQLGQLIGGLNVS
jgi:ABC-type uncharacterized transport system ATPase subunit